MSEINFNDILLSFKTIRSGSNQKNNYLELRKQKIKNIEEELELWEKTKNEQKF